MRALLAVSRPNVEGWRQIGDLGLALLLCALIGVEREIRQKSAGLRTHTLVGVGAALFVLVSKYAFTDVLVPGQVVLDPSRMAAQIVTGIGFIGGGLIFVRRDAVHGLTTAAAVWVTAAIGAAAGGDLPLLAACATVAYFIIVVGFSPLARRLPVSSTATSTIRIRYHDGRGVLRTVLGHTAAQGFLVAEVATESVDAGWGSSGGGREHGSLVEVTLQVHGRGSVNHLAAELSEVPGVETVVADDIHSAGE